MQSLRETEKEREDDSPPFYAQIHTTPPPNFVFSPFLYCRSLPKVYLLSKFLWKDKRSNMERVAFLLILCMLS